MRTLRDTWLIFQRSVTLTLRNPVWLIMGLLQPILYLLLFGPLLKSIASMPGFPPGGAFNVFVPGILVMTALFSSAFVGFGLCEELREGVVERMRVTPMSRVAMLLGGRCATSRCSSARQSCWSCWRSRSASRSTD